MEKILEEMEDLHKRDRLFRQKTLGLQPVFFPPDCQRLYDRDRQHQLEARMEKIFVNTEYQDMDGPTFSSPLSAKPATALQSHPTPPKMVVDPEKYQALMKDTKDTSSKINNLLARIREQKEILKHKLDSSTTAPPTVRPIHHRSTAVTQTDHALPHTRILKEDATQTSAKKASPPPSHSSGTSLQTISSTSTAYHSLPSDHGYLVDLNEALTESRMNSFDSEDIDDSMVHSYHRQLLERASKSKFPDSSRFPAQSSDIEETSFVQMQSLPSSISFGDSISKEAAPEQDICPQPRPQFKPVHISPLKKTFKPPFLMRSVKEPFTKATESPKSIFPPLTVPKTVWTPDKGPPLSPFQDLADSISGKVTSSGSNKKSSPESSEKSSLSKNKESSPPLPQSSENMKVQSLTADFCLPRHIQESAELDSDLRPEEYNMLLEHLSNEFFQKDLSPFMESPSTRRRKMPTTPRIVDFGEMLIPTELSTIPELDSRQLSQVPQQESKAIVGEEEEEQDLDTALLEANSSTSTLVAESSSTQLGVECSHSLDHSSISHSKLAITGTSKSSESCIQAEIITQSTPIRPMMKSVSNLEDEPEPSLFSFDVSSIKMDGAQENLTPTPGRSPRAPHHHAPNINPSLKEISLSAHGSIPKDGEFVILITPQLDPDDQKTPTKSIRDQFSALSFSTPKSRSLMKVQSECSREVPLREITLSQFVSLESFHSTPLVHSSVESFTQPAPCKTFHNDRPNEGFPFSPPHPFQNGGKLSSKDSEKLVALEPLSTPSTPETEENSFKEVRFEEGVSKSSPLFPLQPDTQSTLHGGSSKKSDSAGTCSKYTSETIFAPLEAHSPTTKSFALLPPSHSGKDGSQDDQSSGKFVALTPEYTTNSSNNAQNKAGAEDIIILPFLPQQDQTTPKPQSNSNSKASKPIESSPRSKSNTSASKLPATQNSSDDFKSLKLMEHGSSSEQSSNQWVSSWSQEDAQTSSSFAPLKPDSLSSEGLIERKRSATPSYKIHHDLLGSDSMSESLMSFVKHEQSIQASTPSSSYSKCPPRSAENKRFPKKSNFKQRTKRLWNNLEEVQEKKGLEARKEAAILNRQRMKEYSNQLKHKTPKKTPKN